VGLQLDGAHIPDALTKALRGHRSIDALELRNMRIGRSEAATIASLNLLGILNLSDCVIDSSATSLSSGRSAARPHYFTVNAVREELPASIAPDLAIVLADVEFVRLSGSPLHAAVPAVAKSCPRVSQLFLTGSWSDECGHAVEDLPALEHLWMHAIVSPECDTVALRGLKRLKLLQATAISSDYSALIVDSSPDLTNLEVSGDVAPRGVLARLELARLDSLSELRISMLTVSAIKVDGCPKLADVYVFNCKMTSEMAEALGGFRGARVHISHCAFLDDAEAIISGRRGTRMTNEGPPMHTD
jgi:hypothetical protein